MGNRKFAGKRILAALLLATLIFGACGCESGGADGRELESQGQAEDAAQTEMEVAMEDTAENEEFSGEREEIVLTETFVTPAMKEAIEGFNRGSRKYRVVVRESELTEDYEEFLEKIRMQLSAGEGPDILGEYALWDSESAAAEGFLERLDDVTQDDEDLFASAMQSGVMDGVRYGLPVRYNLIFLAGSTDLIRGRESWDAREMMKAVEESGAEYLCNRYSSLLDGESIVYYFGLLDNEDTVYIDWEAGVSHLAEEPFVELLKFAKKYAADPQGMDEREIGPALQQGRIALTVEDLVSLDSLQELEEYFEGREVYIGYPCKEGSGVYMQTFNYYLNAASEHKEGAKEFLRYLLTEEAQFILTDPEGMSSGFPVRRSILETNVGLMQKSLGVYEDAVSRESLGLVFQPHLMSEEMGRRFLALVERAELDDWNVSRIEDILEEELEPFFEGTKTARETAEALDNRVQLYLNER